MKKWIKRLLWVVVILGIAALVKLVWLRPKPVMVDVVVVGRGEVEEVVTNSRAGTVKARRRAKLSPEFGGQVIELPFAEGDRVLKGQIVLRLEDSLQRARLDLARRELVTLEAEHRRVCLEAERAAREFERNDRLAREGIVSEDLLDSIDSLRQSTEAACEAANANVSRAESAIGLALTELEKTVLRAPFDGVIAEISTEVGEWTTPSPPAMPVPPIIDILDPSSIYVSAPMDEVDSGRIRTGQPARVTVDSHRDRRFAGQVSRVAPYVLDLEAQNRTVEIEVELDEHQEVFLPGTSADVEVILTSRDDVLRVPTAALVEGTRVLLLEEGLLVDRPVTPGLRNWDFTEILEGLQEGDRVVISLDRTEVVAGAKAEITEAEGD